MDVSLLGGVAGFLFPSGSALDVADSGCERLENGIEASHCLLGTADHHAVSTLDAPDTAAGAHVDVMNAFLLKNFRAANVVLPHRVAAIDDGVAGFEFVGKGHDGLLRRIACRNHHPNCTRLGELLYEVVERTARSCALFA